MDVREALRIVKDALWKAGYKERIEPEVSAPRFGKVYTVIELERPGGTILVGEDSQIYDPFRVLKRWPGGESLTPPPTEGTILDFPTIH